MGCALLQCPGVNSALHPSGVTKSRTSFGGVRAGMSHLTDGREHCVISHGMRVPVAARPGCIHWRIQELWGHWTNIQVEPFLRFPFPVFPSAPSPYPLCPFHPPSESGRNPSANRTSVQFTAQNLQICDKTVRLGFKPKLGVLQY